MSVTNDTKNKIGFTTNEICEMFDSSDLNPEFKSAINVKFNAMCQAMYNAVHKGEKAMNIRNSHGDWWIEEYNEFVKLYQRYYN